MSNEGRKEVNENANIERAIFRVEARVKEIRYQLRLLAEKQRIKCTVDGPEGENKLGALSPVTDKEAADWQRMIQKDYPGSTKFFILRLLADRERAWRKWVYGAFDGWHWEQEPKKEEP